MADTEKRIYAMEAGEYVKIGVSQSPAVRAKSLQAGCPFCIEVANVIRSPHPEPFETILHYHFREYEAGGHGGSREWFNIPDTEVEWLRNVRYLSRSKIRERCPDAYEQLKDRYSFGTDFVDRAPSDTETEPGRLQDLKLGDGRTPDREIDSLQDLKL